MREKILIDALEEIKKINALSISGNSWAYHKDEINRVITKALSDYASAPNPNRCRYEQLVEKFFGLPDTVDEKTEIKADFGLLVSLLAWASSAPESGGEQAKEHQEKICKETGKRCEFICVMIGCYLQQEKENYMTYKELPLKTIMDVREWTAAGISKKEISKKVSLPLETIEAIINRSETPPTKESGGDEHFREITLQPDKASVASHSSTPSILLDTETDEEGYKHYQLKVIVSTKEENFSTQKMFVLITNAIRGENENRYVLAYPPNSEQEDKTVKK